MRFDIIDIDENEWIALDYLMEDVEKGIQKEDVLLNNETFLHLLCAVKFDTNNFMKIPNFIQMSKLCEKYCQQVNPNVIEIINKNKLSKIDVYKEYLGL